MKAIQVFFVFLSVLLFCGCAAEKKEPSSVQEKEAVISMDQAITEYLENSLIPPPPGAKTFAAYDLFGVSGNKDEKIAYLWTLILAYGVDSRDDICLKQGMSGPLALILKEENSSYKVVGHREPGDGAYYWPDIKEIFPEEYHDRILNPNTGKSKDLGQSIRDKATNYFRTEKTNHL